MEKITVYVSEEIKKKLKDKKVSMSQFCRSAIKGHLTHYEATNRYKHTPKGRKQHNESQRRGWRKKHPFKTLECANSKCSKVFTQKNTKQKYCSPKCRKLPKHKSFSKEWIERKREELQKPLRKVRVSLK